MDVMPNSQRLFAYHVAAAHGLLRLTLGVAFLMHGGVRIHAGVAGFVAHTAATFADKGSVLPTGMVRAFAYTIPWVEAGLGGLIVVGLLSLPALVLAGLWMAALVLGSCTVQDWPAVGLQLDYAVVIALLIVGLPYDQWSADGLVRGWRASRGVGPRV